MIGRLVHPLIIYFFHTILCWIHQKVATANMTRLGTDPATNFAPFLRFLKILSFQRWKSFYKACSTTGIPVHLHFKPALCQLNPGLRDRLNTKTSRANDSGAKVAGASLRRSVILQRRSNACGALVKRAKQVASDARRKDCEERSQKGIELQRRLDRAAVRRKSNKSGVPKRPGCQQATNVIGVSHREEILRQLTALQDDFESVSSWLKSPVTIGLVAEWLASVGVEGGLCKRLLALIYMARAQQLFDQEDAADTRMQNEAIRFHEAFDRALRGTLDERGSFQTAFTRARRFHKAWAAQDIPKQARIVDDAIHRLHGQLLSARVAQLEQGVEPVPPEEILAQIRALSGQAAEEEARQLFLRHWSIPYSRGAAVEERAASLESTIRGIALRAMQDSIKEQISSYNYSGLFSLLRELQEVMLTLNSHSRRVCDDLLDHFDVDFIEQQANAQCLSLSQVQQLVLYITRTISGWQAPVDDAETLVWVSEVERTISESINMSLDEFVQNHLVEYIFTAFESIGRVYKRIVELTPRQGSQRF